MTKHRTNKREIEREPVDMMPSLYADPHHQTPVLPSIRRCIQPGENLWYRLYPNLPRSISQ